MTPHSECLANETCEPEQFSHQLLFCVGGVYLLKLWFCRDEQDLQAWGVFLGLVFPLSCQVTWCHNQSGPARQPILGL